MKREDIEKLLGGYATNTLTEQERRALFEAALSDQALFDALAREEAFKEVLEDPRCRREIEQALQQQGFLARLSGWMRRPQAWALAGTLAATAVIAVVVTRVDRVERAAQVPIQVAKQEAPAAVAPAAPPAERHGAASAPREESRLERQPRAAAKPRQFTPPAVTGTKGAEQVAALEPPSVPAPTVLTDKPAVSGAVGGLPAPAAPPRFASQQLAAAPDKDKLTTRYRASDAVSVVTEAQPEGEAKALGGAAKRQVQLPLDLRYKVFARGADGRFAETNVQNAQQAPGTQLRVVFTANQDGYLYVSGARGVLFSTKAVAGVPYAVDPSPQDRRLTAVLSRTPVSAPPYQALLRDSRAKERSDSSLRLVLEVDLSREYAQ